jgi:hypothetical protein
MKALASALCLVALSGLAAGQDAFGRLDRQKEIELGRQAYDDLLYFGKISKNQAYVKRVNRIFDTLVAAMPEKEYPYQVVVVADESLNAFCLPGGYIAVFEGLVSRVPDDDALAFVLAHEIGHAAQRHWVRQSRKSQGDLIFGTLMGQLAGTLFVNLSRLSHSRQHEAEADRFGADLYVRAGYDPRDAAESMRLIAKVQKGSKLPPYLHSHPNPESRVKAIDERVQDLAKEARPPVEVPKVTDLEAKLYGKLPEVPIAPNPWFPIVPGAEWEYRIDGPATSAYRVRCISAADSGKGTVGRFEHILPNRSVIYQVLTTADGVWRRSRPEREESPWQPDIAFPSGEATAGPWTYAHVGTEDVETPAGKFPGCLKLKARNGSRELTLWFAKDVGLVRRLNEEAGIDEKLVRFTKG